MKRNAFGMIFAIIIVILVATLGILGVKLSSRTLNTTTNQHIAMQLDLYVNSTIELAILYIQRNGFLYGEGTQTQRANPMLPIERKITYGANNEYQFTYKMTPLFNEVLAGGAGAGVTTTSDDIIATKANTMVVDVSGFVVNPITNQTFRVTKRQIVKP